MTKGEKRVLVMPITWTIIFVGVLVLANIFHIRACGNVDLVEYVLISIFSSMCYFVTLIFISVVYDYHKGNTIHD